MSTAQASFDRLVRVIVIPNTLTPTPGEEDPFDYTEDLTEATIFPSRLDDGTTGFRIKGVVNKIAGVTTATPNSITFYVYNLGPHSRALISNLDNTVIVEAGYGNSAQRIFKGNISWTRTRKIGPDYVTEVQAASGLFAFQNARIDTSFKAGVSHGQIIDTLIGALKPAGINPGLVMGVPKGGPNYGTVLSGNAVKELKRVCDGLDLQFSIQNEDVLILPYGSDRGTPAPLISPNTGMIGIPEIRSAGALKGQLISFKTLMMPQLEIAQQVVINSKFVNGVWVTVKVVHDFDSWEGPFFTNVECA